MAFWLEREWQERSARCICAALDQVNDELLPQNLSSGSWTKPMFRALAPVALELCGDFSRSAACSFGGAEEVGHRKGWLYDFCCWVTDPEQRLWGMPLVAESEWLGWTHVLDDFEKLPQARAGLRVLVFQHHKDVPADWRSELLSRAQKFAESASTDAYLFAFWRDKKFHYSSNLWE